MEKLLRKNDKILLAGASWLAGNSILNSFKKAGYGKKDIGGEILRPSRKELNYLDSDLEIIKDKMKIFN